jgi:hypothetical protein
MWQEILDFFGAERYSQHSICLTNDSLMIFLYVASDLTIFAAYFVIGIAMMMTGRLPSTTLPYRRTIFGMFIFLCGLTHLTDVMVLFSGVYRFDILVRAATAGVSVMAAMFVAQDVRWGRGRPLG